MVSYDFGGSGSATAAWTSWTSWVYNDNSTTTTGGSTIVWKSWVNGSDSYISMNDRGWVRSTPEEIEARQCETERLRLENEARQKEWAASQGRAKQLLFGFLNRTQKRDLNKKGCFEVRSRSGRRFRLIEGQIPRELDRNGKEIASYCIHPQKTLPECDQLLMWKLMLEDQEDEFMRVANRRVLA